MSSTAHSLSSAAPAMRFARTTVVSAWFIVFALFALSGSGTRSASGLLLFAGGLMALAMIAPMRWTLRRAPEPASRRDEGPVGSTDEHDLVRMDSDKG